MSIDSAASWLTTAALALAVGAGVSGCRGAGSAPSEAPSPGRGGSTTDPDRVGAGAGAGAGAASALAASPRAFRRLTTTQFRNALKTLFGDDIRVGPVEEDTRASGLFVIDAASIVTTLSGVEQYQSAVDGVLDQVFSDATRRAALVGCVPQLSAGDACTQHFLSRFGRLAFRRALTPAEQARYAGVAVNASGDGFDGIRLALSGLLQSPNFLYRTELGKPSPERADALVLSDLELASKLAFFLWNAPPDDALLSVAEGGGLSTTEGAKAQALRLLSEPAGRRAISGFASDLFWIDRLDTIAKDAALYPQFTPTLKSAMKIDFLNKWETVAFASNAGTLELFTTRAATVNQELAAFYGVAAPGATADTFVSVELPAGGERVGILGSAAWLSMFGNQKEGSPTLRGKFIREVLTCTAIPPPPTNVDTTLQDPPVGVVTTKRERLSAHATQPTCAGCHGLMDPVGFALEHFDATGSYRELDNGKPVDSSGALDGVAYAGLPGLARALTDSDKARRCLVGHLYDYATGATGSPGEDSAVDQLTAAFVQSGYRIPELLASLVQSDGFRFVKKPE